jgi:hypothetical protein
MTKRKSRKSVLENDNIETLYSGWYTTLHLPTTVSWLKDVKERYSADYEQINMIFDHEGYSVYGVLSPEKTAERLAKRERQEYENLKFEFAPEPEVVNLDEETKEEKPVSWFKKLFRR